MKQYLLIPIEEISDRISYLEKEIANNEGSVLADYDSHEKQILKKFQQKGEIVEIEEIKEEDWWNKREFFATLFKKDYKLIKTIK